MFRYSPYGIKSPAIFSVVYEGFINWCKSQVKEGIFSTYCDGEPVCYSNGVELSYRQYLQACGK